MNNLTNDIAKTALSKILVIGATGATVLFSASIGD